MVGGGFRGKTSDWLAQVIGESYTMEFSCGKVSRHNLGCCEINSDFRPVRISDQAILETLKVLAKF